MYFLRFFFPLPIVCFCDPFLPKSAFPCSAPSGPLSLSSGVHARRYLVCQSSQVELPNGYLSECNNINLLVVILRGKQTNKKTNQKTAKQRAGEHGLCCSYSHLGTLPLPQGRGQSAVSIATRPQPAAAWARWPWSGAGPTHHCSPHPEPRELAHGKSLGLAGPEASP